jgi:SOS-response transcriptional repressor LexA
MTARFGLTPLQHRTLQLITDYVGEHGYSPSYREIASALDTTVSNAHRIVMILLSRGAVVELDVPRRSIVPSDIAVDAATEASVKGRPIDKRCTNCGALYVTRYRLQDHCWNCKVRELTAAETPVWAVAG